MSIINTDNHISDAPCYWYLKDDGAQWRCTECSELFNPEDVYFALTPDGNKGIICFNCIDDDWLHNAKNMGTL